jgi:hypothetical protein
LRLLHVGVSITYLLTRSPAENWVTWRVDEGANRQVGDQMLGRVTSLQFALSPTLPLSHSPTRSSHESLLVNHTILHNEHDILHRMNVCQGVARNRDNICPLSRLKRAEMLVPAEQLRAI